MPTLFLKAHTDNEAITNSSAFIFSSVVLKRAHSCCGMSKLQQFLFLTSRFFFRCVVLIFLYCFFKKRAWLFTIAQRQIPQTESMFTLMFQYIWDFILGGWGIGFNIAACEHNCPQFILPTDVNVVCSLSMLLFRKICLFVFTGILINRMLGLCVCASVCVCVCLWEHN